MYRSVAGSRFGLTLLAWCARLVLLAYAFQLGAIDHYRLPAAEARSVDHAAHCHGDPSGCANGVSLTYTLAEAPLVVAPPAARLSLAPERVYIPQSRATAALEQPPRQLPASTRAGELQRA